MHSVDRPLSSTGMCTFDVSQLNRLSNEPPRSFSDCLFSLEVGAVNEFIYLEPGVLVR